MDIIKISDAEYEIMEIIWNEGREVTTVDIIEKLGEDNFWKHTTILTLAKRLVDKNVLNVRKEKRVNYYSPNISKDEYKSYQADGFIENMYGGSIKSLVASLYDNKKIDENDLKELKDWIRRL
ncbi:BlaI/MecI/CopY family transcriptional regulator [Tissierella pigra]|uniref:BlaI/MecI/CopY family transcriptional regulator n=1 Tax=Tissierella pigra TaxID=2607614 RepID=A0A6N7XV64_9FIRM|nr:BlaI/MecI/CopY family transcriptional regulator [Tissierella pigra]MBU5427674.1 BlaI/MecI/CopY family transcriptional regulator [Tissierella pigra]MSU00424.1 BlaI/MecI/CopY family transcriptional regulator [Tissierella pigra]